MLLLVAVLVILILPLPSFLLDLLLVLSLTSAVMILMTVIFIQTAVDSTAFPMVLLVSTIAFAGLIMQGNFVIITKGATRIAEVAARFTLDALPG
ncbi:MAG: flagellar biosynthesis protein FlhA [Rhodospirillaceae bacterium]|nr:MAG: flagellar biosynthesis protein FlhA [Rhodospirillaceae bacterium]